jgi:hypothetical protein
MIGLIDFDGKITNLALMKLSTHYKAQGEQVEFAKPGKKYDKVFCSVLFTWNKDKAAELIDQYPNIEFGGTGWDLTKTLPDEIEACKPDYGLYTVDGILPRLKGGIATKASKIKKAEEIVDAGIGFTSRGCIRQCGFCFVPRKEGKLHQVAEVSDLINPRSNVVILLDNNLTADPDCIDKLHEFRDRGLTVDITQGIDVRLITPEIAQALSEVRLLRSLHYAWDLMGFERQVLDGIKVLSQSVKKWRHMCFMLTGYNTLTSEDEYRFRKLREIGVDPYVMPYNKQFPTEKHRHFARWVNGRIYKTCSFEEYRPWIKAREQELEYLLS